MVVVAAESLRQVLYVGDLAACRGFREVGGKLVELVRHGRITLRLGSLGGALQIRSDLLGNLLVLGRVRLLELLKRAHQLRERRKLAVVGLRGRQRAHATQTVIRAIGRQARVGENRLQIAGGKIVYGTGTHAFLIGMRMAVH